ncbi:hypothetical protein JL722_15011 [Aureococcus anophagefferens]|nr:hypothetical protein JL722_15011 [Aureococcus anophagefferens]
MSRLSHQLGELISSKQASRKKAVEAITSMLEDVQRRGALSDREWLALVRSRSRRQARARGRRQGRKPPKREFGDFVERVVKDGGGDGADALRRRRGALRGARRRHAAARRAGRARRGRAGPERALLAALPATSAAPLLMVLCGVLEARPPPRAAAPRRVVWDGDAIVVAAAHGLALGALVERREAWCACLAKAVKAVARVGRRGATPLSWAFDDRRWALIALEKLSAESAAALDAADKAAAAADRARGAGGVVGATGLADAQAARAFWRSPLFAAAHLEGDDDDGKAAVLSCACAALRGFVAASPRGVSLAGGPDDVADVPRETDGDGDEPNDERAPPKHRRHRLARWATRVQSDSDDMMDDDSDDGMTHTPAPAAYDEARDAAAPPLPTAAARRGVVGLARAALAPASSFGHRAEKVAAAFQGVLATSSAAAADLDRGERPPSPKRRSTAAARGRRGRRAGRAAALGLLRDAWGEPPARPGGRKPATLPTTNADVSARARAAAFRARRARGPARGRARVPGREALLDGARQLLFASDDAAGGRLGAAAERDGSARAQLAAATRAFRAWGGAPATAGVKALKTAYVFLLMRRFRDDDARARAAAADGAGALFESYGVASHAKDPAAAARHLLHRCNAAEVVLSLAAALARPAGRAGGAARALAALRVVLDASGLSTCEATAAEAPHYASCLTAALAALVHACAGAGEPAAGFPESDEAACDLLDRTVRSAAATAEGCKALAPLLPTAAILAGSLAAAYGRAEDDAGDAGWIAAARARGRPTAAAARRWRSAPRPSRPLRPQAAARPPERRGAVAGVPLRRARPRPLGLAAVHGRRGRRRRPARAARAHLCPREPAPAARGRRDPRRRGLVGARGTRRVVGRRERALAGDCLGALGARGAAAPGAAAPAPPRTFDGAKGSLRRARARAVDGAAPCPRRATAKALAADDEANGDVAAAARDAEHDAHAALLLPFLETRAVAYAATAAGDAAGDADEGVDCWGDGVWAVDGDFGRWVTGLVPALLRAPRDAKAFPGDAFLGRCSALAAAAPSFAALVFPAVVYDLVGSRAGDNGDRPRRDRETDDNDGEAGAEGVARDAIDAASALLGDSDALGRRGVEVEADADAWLSRVVEVKRSTGGWRDVLGEVDAALHARRVEGAPGAGDDAVAGLVATALRRLGLHHVGDAYLGAAAELAGGFGAEARWRAADWAWDAPDDAHDTFDGAFYGALRRLSARRRRGARAARARETLAVDGGAASTLSPKTVAALRGRLLAVAEASEVVGAVCGPGDVAGVLDLWQRRGGAADLASGALFGDVGEVALASREATLRAAKTAASSVAPEAHDLLAGARAHLLDFVDEACARGAVGVASSAVARLRVAAGGGAAGAARRRPVRQGERASSAILDRYLRAASDAAAKDRGADCRRSARLALGDYVAVLQAKLEALQVAGGARRAAADRSKQLRDAEALFDAVSQLKGPRGRRGSARPATGPARLAADPDAVEHLRRQCVVLRRECDIDDEALENLTSQRRAGVLEWVDHTIPFGAYLTDRSGSGAGAHSRYHPSDLSHQECRAKLTNAKDGKGSAKKADEARRRKRRAFDDICAKFRPAFRFFFVEHGRATGRIQGSKGLDRRGAYTRSVAANAMVGHVLGIGDRHAQNILVDTRSGEQVHIDFGVAFDQGKALTAPETVPFRLTRDVVDGMGCHGTHGAFTLAAEATMKTLRRHAGEIVTILDVLIHDPLYRWMVSPKDARHRQRHDDADDGDDASRPGGGESNAGDANDGGGALQGEAEAWGYEARATAFRRGQVKNLVADATDPENLCVLFPGWAPWL